MEKISAVKLAKYILYKIREQMKYEGMGAEDWDITPSRLQKLLYFCQSYSIAFTGEKLFFDKIEVKDNRPFIESVYQEYENYAGNVIPYDDDDFEEVDNATSSIVHVIICKYLELSDYALTAEIQRSRAWPDCLKEINRDYGK